MKLIAIGDIHGRTAWKQVVNGSKADIIVFIGDYFDAKEPISVAGQIANFRQIVGLKRQEPGSVILLCGNHDYHYLRSSSERYVGFQPLGSIDIADALDDAMRDESIQMAYAHSGVLFTHAGVTKTWLSSQGYAGGPIPDFINDLFQFQPGRFRFQMGENQSKTGDDVTQSPIWVRPASLRKDAVDGFIQVVGHTRQAHIIIEDGLVLIDALGSGEYLLVDERSYQIETIVPSSKI